jgi:hypothetical protein
MNSQHRSATEYQLNFGDDSEEGSLKGDYIFIRIY